MNLCFPKRLFASGDEPQAQKINNSCKVTLFKTLEDCAPVEFQKVCNDYVFSDILALQRNNVGYSGRLIHSMLCRQLVTMRKHELWFVFGNLPLRFSLQEFHAVTGLNCSGDHFVDDLEQWEDDNGFWANVLRNETKISILDIKKYHLDAVKKNWTPEDKLRLVYLFVIVGFVLAKDEKKEISHKHIKLVMDISKVSVYPWGRESFTLLVDSIKSVRDCLANPTYVLDGFSYALQIWVMEAIPVIGEALGKVVKESLVDGPRCTRWKGACKVAYDYIINVENMFNDKDILYPCISATGNADIYHSADYMWPHEVDDERVDVLNQTISTSYDFRGYVWEVEGQIEEDDT